MSALLPLTCYDSTPSSALLLWGLVLCNNPPGADSSRLKPTKEPCKSACESDFALIRFACPKPRSWMQTERGGQVMTGAEQVASDG